MTEGPVTAPAMTPEQFREMLKNPAMMAVFAEEAKSAKENEAAEERARFESLGDTLGVLVDEIESKYAARKWFKRDRATKKQTTEVSGVGYHVSGLMPVTVGGRTREARVTVFVKWNPKGGSAPADVTGSED